MEFIITHALLVFPFASHLFEIKMNWNFLILFFSQNNIELFRNSQHCISAVCPTRLTQGKGRIQGRKSALSELSWRNETRPTSIYART